MSLWTFWELEFPILLKHTGITYRSVMGNSVSQEWIDAYMDGQAPRTEEMELALQDSGGP